MLKPLGYKDIMNAMVAIKENYWLVMYADIIYQSPTSQKLKMLLSDMNNTCQYIIQELKINRSVLVDYENENYKDND